MILVQDPAPVHPPCMSVFNDGEAAFSSDRAQEEFHGLTAVLAEHEVEFCSVLDLAVRLPLAQLRDLAAAAVRQPADRAEAVRQNLAAMTARELVQLVVERPELTLVPDARLAAISPDAAAELYTLEPLYGLMFPRDHVLSVDDLCFVARFSREHRQREAELVVPSLATALPRLELVRLEDPFEGGDALACRPRRVLFLSHGYRTSRRAAVRIAGTVAERGWTTVLLADRRRIPEEFHLDHWAATVGSTLLCAEQRLPDVATVEWISPGAGALPNAGRLEEVLGSLGMTLLPVSRRLAGLFGMNLLDLPDRDVVVGSSSAPGMASVVAGLGKRFLPLGFSTIESNFGSIHCATNELAAGA